MITGRCRHSAKRSKKKKRSYIQYSMRTVIYTTATFVLVLTGISLHLHKSDLIIDLLYSNSGRLVIRLIGVGLTHLAKQPV